MQQWIYNRYLFYKVDGNCGVIYSWSAYYKVTQEKYYTFAGGRRRANGKVNTVKTSESAALTNVLLMPVVKVSTRSVPSR